MDAGTEQLIDLSEIEAGPDSVENPPPGESAALVRTKILPPRPGVGAIARPRLIDRLEVPSRVILATAPAGYGKSTILSQWAHEDPRPVAWLTLDGGDSDVVRFWSYLLTALNEEIPEALRVQAGYRASTTEEALPLVINGLAAVEGGAIIVLDDYHEVSSQDVDQAVEMLIRRLPSSSCVAISSRRDSDLSLSRWRASEQLIELRQSHLRFRSEEATAWLEARMLSVDQKIVDASLQATEGWPAAYALVMGPIMASPDPMTLLGTLGGANRNIADYIREEVLTDLSDKDRRILHAAAACDAVCGDLVDQMLDIRGSAGDLERLEHSDVLLEALDGTATWYRLHRLVSEYLLAGENAAPHTRESYLRASDWLSNNGNPRESFNMALLAGDHLRAADILNASFLEYVGLRQWETLRRDLDRIDPEIGATSASYLVTSAWLLAEAGRQKDALSAIDRALELDETAPLPDGAPTVRAGSELIKSIFVVEGIDAARQSAARAAATAGGSTLYRQLASFAVGYAEMLYGDLTEARAALMRTQTGPEQSLRAYATAWLVVIDVLEGDSNGAEHRLKDAQRLFEVIPARAVDPPLVVARAVVELDRGHPIEAAAELDECLQRLGTHDPSDQLEVLVWLATAEAAVGRTDRARNAIDRARDIIQRLGRSKWHDRRLDELEQAMGPSKELVGIDPGLTDRERRILQLLASTHLSQREIGREMGIAFNTVKSHVKSIYVKIGATSREEAAQIGRARGLI